MNTLGLEIVSLLDLSILNTGIKEYSILFYRIERWRTISRNVLNLFIHLSITPASRNKLDIQWRRIVPIRNDLIIFISYQYFCDIIMWKIDKLNMLEKHV